MIGIVIKGCIGLNPNSPDMFVKSGKNELVVEAGSNHSFTNDSDEGKAERIDGFLRDGTLMPVFIGETIEFGKGELGTYVLKNVHLPKNDRRNIRQ